MTLDREEKRRLLERKLAEAKHKEKRKLVLSAIGIALCFVIIVVVKKNAADSAETNLERLGSQTDYAGLLPELDANLLAQIKDATHADRVVKERNAFREVSHAAKALVGSWLYVLGEPQFPFEDGVTKAAASRGKPFRLRGEILDRFEETNADGEREVWWTLQTLDGHKFQFIDITASDSIALRENFVLADGYFFKYYDSKFEGVDMTAPLFVGRAVEPSFKLAAPISEPSLTLLANVKDQPLGTHNNPTLLDRKPELWHLMNVARTVGRDPDLLAKATKDSILLDEASLKELSKNPGVFRGRMFELGGMVREEGTSQVGENPLRERNISSAWIRNDLVGTNLTHLKAPGNFQFGLNRGPMIYHGYFLMLWAYEDTEGNHLRTPVFVVTDAVAQEKITPPFAGQIIMMFLGIAIAIGFILFTLIKRDKKASHVAMGKVAARRAARKNPS